MSSGTLSQARRAARIRHVVEEVMSRRAAGETLPDARILAEHAELSPELARELTVLSMLERARTSAGSRYTGPLQPLGEDAFEGYALLREVHRGGQGVVYEATQKSTGRRVAIKIMREGLFDRDTARFEREVKILGQIEHPGVVGILASGVRGGHFYYVMDYVEGAPLDEYAASVERQPRRILAVMEEVCDAVNAAHLRGIIHRDLKPGNILVDAQGHPRILDFGLARITAEDPSLHITAAGQFVGSMPWASPEQAAGDQARVDLRTDVYSLGVVLYQALTGRFPYPVEGPQRDVMNNILTAAPLRLRSSASRIGADVEAIVLKCLSKERERRYQSAGELAAEIRRYLSDRPILARPPSAMYQVRAFARRHKVLVVGATTAAAALFLGLVGTTAGLIEASVARHAAVLDRDTARKAEKASEARRIEAERHSYSASIAAADSALQAQDAAGAISRLADAPGHLRDWEWRYLAGRTDRSAAVLEGPPAIHALTSPDGKQIAVLLREGTLRLLDAQTLRVRWQVDVPADTRTALEQTIPCFSPDGARIVTAHGRRLLVWAIGTDAPVADLDFASMNWGYVNASIRADGKVLVACGREGRMRAWDLDSRRVIHDFEGLDRYGGVAFSPDGRVLAAATVKGVSLYDGRTFEPLPISTASTSLTAGSLGGIHYSPDGALIAAARGSDILILSAADLTVRSVLHGHTQRPEAWSFSADGQRLVSTGWDRTLRVWDLGEVRQERLYWGHTDHATGAAFLADGRRVISCANDGTIRFWSLDHTGEPPTFELGATPYSLCILPDGRMMAAGHGRARWWELAVPKSPIPPPVPMDMAMWQARIALTADGDLLARPSDPSGIQVWDLDKARLLWEGPTGSERIGHIAFSPDARTLAAVGSSDGLMLWEARSGRQLWAQPPQPASATQNIAFSPDGSLLAVVIMDRVDLWDTRSGARVGSLRAEEPSETNCAAFSPDQTLLAIGDSTGNVRLWDVAQRRNIRTLTGMMPVVWSVAFNPSGTRLATGSQDRTARIWDPRSGDQLLVLRGHTGTVMSLAWTPDGQTLASGSYDGTVRIWKAP